VSPALIQNVKYVVQQVKAIATNVSVTIVYKTAPVQGKSHKYFSFDILKSPYIPDHLKKDS
jgi:hypothetical protein